ncbi:MAG: hypothetical protein AAB501_01110 [Patescibacteria group bacterium]
MKDFKHPYKLACPSEALPRHSLVSGGGWAKEGGCKDVVNGSTVLSRC